MEKCLQREREDLSSNPQRPPKKVPVAVCPSSPGCSTHRQGNHWGVSAASLTLESVKLTLKRIRQGPMRWFSD